MCWICIMMSTRLLLWIGCRFCMVFSEVPFMSELNPEYLKVVKCRGILQWADKLEDYHWWYIISKAVLIRNTAIGWVQISYFICLICEKEWLNSKLLWLLFVVLTVKMAQMVMLLSPQRPSICLCLSVTSRAYVRLVWKVLNQSEMYGAISIKSLLLTGYVLLQSVKLFWRSHFTVSKKQFLKY